MTSGLYEMDGTQVKKYYFIAGMTVAMYDSADSQNPLKYLLTDQLSSVVAVTDGSGTLISQQRYLPFGQVRSINSSQITQTDFGFTTVTLS